MTTYDVVTMRQRQVLLIISAAYDAHDDSPTVRGIAATLRLAPSAVQHHLQNLEAKGLIARRPGRQLALTPTGAAAIAPPHTEMSALWCPTCGDCSCPRPEDSLDHYDCPLHGPESSHP